MRQALYLVNSDQLEGKIADSPRIKRLAQATQSDTDSITELYLATLLRVFTADEMGKSVVFVSGKSNEPLQQPLTEKKAAEGALAKVKTELAKANTDDAAAETTANAAETATANAKTAAATTRAAQAAAGKIVSEKRKLANEIKAKRDKLVNNEKAANTRLAQPNQRVTAAQPASAQLKLQSLQDLSWALLNSKEFLFNH